MPIYFILYIIKTMIMVYIKYTIFMDINKMQYNILLLCSLDSDYKCKAK